MTSLCVSRGSGAYVAGEAHAALYERLRMRSVGRRPLIHAFGHGGYDNGLKETNFLSSGFWPLFAPLADAGYPVICGELGGSPLWGNDTTITRVGQLVAYASSGFGFDTSGVFMLGISMGMLPLLRWAKDNRATVKAVYGAIPVTNLASIHDRNPNGYAAEIEAAYGGLAAYQAALPTHDPSAYAASLAGLPIRLLYHTDDTVVVPSDVTGFAASVGASCSLVSGTGGHVATFDPLDVLSFFEAHA